MQSKIDELLVEWELARQDGRVVTAQQLCADSPDLVHELESQIQLLVNTSWMFDESNAPAENAEPFQEPVPDTNPQEFANAVVNSQLFSQSELAQIESQWLGVEKLNNLPTTREATIALANQLVDAKLLTDYQSKVLLGVKRGPLKMDRYTILNMIDAGGMGEVYRAMHTAMGREVALKILPANAVGSATKQARFFREIKAASQVSHPNMVTAYDAYDADGSCFLAMELVNGDNLVRLITGQGTLPEKEAIELIAKIASAAQAAHDAGIVHRDIKPSNILLDESGEPKLLDLGLARLKQDTINQTLTTTELTNAGLPMGTIAYMSPEQAMNAHEAGPAADIYSLGCTLFYLLKGHPPFADENPMRTLISHRETPVEQLMTNNEISPAVRQCISKMMAKEPEHRFRSMAEVASTLSAVAGGQPIRFENNIKTKAANDAGDHGRTAGVRDSKVIPPNSSATLADKRSISDRTGRNPNSPQWMIPAGIIALITLVGLGVAMMTGAFSTTRTGASPSEKDLAKWILNEGGIVSAETEFGPQLFAEMNALPDGDIQIQSVVLDAPAPGALARLADCSTLRAVEISDFSFDSKDSSSLAQLEHLESLVLTRCTLTANFWAGLIQLKDLNDLQLFEIQLEDQEFETIGKLQGLNSLLINHSNCDDSNMAVFRGLTNLQSLDLADTAVTVAALRMAAERSLTDLNLSSTAINDEDFANLPVAQSLKNLNLDFTAASDQAAIYAAKIDGLEELYLEETQISDQGLDEICSSSQQLKLLDISATPITPAAWPKLTALRSLEHLMLSKVQLDGSIIGQLTKMPALVQLSVFDSAISDTAMKQLSGLALIELDLSGSTYSEEALDQFNDANPGCMVFVSE